jgi:hypothetical protein
MGVCVGETTYYATPGNAACRTLLHISTLWQDVYAREEGSEEHALDKEKGGIPAVPAARQSQTHDLVKGRSQYR